MKSLTVFTDGGCSGNPGPGGWAFVLLSDEGKLEKSGGEEQTTNNKMELNAVIQVLKHINETDDLRDSEIHLHTDSQYVQKGITEWIKNWVKNGWKTAAKKPVKNKEYWIELKALADQLTVRWHWVKGHAGITYNERCDELVGQEMNKIMGR